MRYRLFTTTGMRYQTGRTKRLCYFQTRHWSYHWNGCRGYLTTTKLASCKENIDPKCFKSEQTSIYCLIFYLKCGILCVLLVFLKNFDTDSDILPSFKYRYRIQYPLHHGFRFRFQFQIPEKISINSDYRFQFDIDSPALAWRRRQRSADSVPCHH